MTVSRELIRRAIESISSIEGVAMNPESLAEDAVLLAYAFPDEGDYMAACVNTCRSLGALVRNEVASSDLKYNFEGWRSYHYQHRVGQGIKATCRIVYRNIDAGIEVKGFGHRRIPADFYRRMAKLRNATESDESC